MNLWIRRLTNSDILDFLQGYVWSLEGHESTLKVWLIEWDSQGHPHKLAGPGNDNNGVTPVPSPSAASPSHTPKSQRTTTKNRLPPARFGSSGSLQMVSRPMSQGDARYHPASGMMQSQYASSTYQAVGSYAPLTRPQIYNPGQYSGGATPSSSPSFDLRGLSSEQQLGQTHFEQPLTPPRTVSSTSSISSVSTTYVSSIASGVGEVRAPGPSSITSGDSISSSGVSTPGPCIVASCYSPSLSTAGGLSIRGSSSIASDDSAFSAMVGGLSMSGLSSVLSSALSSPTTFRCSSQASTISQPVHGTYELWVYPIPTGTSEETFNAEVLEATLGRYTSHAGITMVNTDEQMQVYVTYHEEEQAKQAAKKLGKVCYKGIKLRAHLKEGMEDGS